MTVHGTSVIENGTERFTVTVKAFGKTRSIGWAPDTHHEEVAARLQCLATWIDDGGITPNGRPARAAP